MKIPVQHIDLTELGYEGYWVEMPRSIREGFLHDFAKMGKATNGSANGETSEEDDAEQTRETNIKMLELISAWNIDYADQEGVVMPLLSKCKTKAEKAKVIAELPVDVIVHVAQRIAGNVQVPEKTKDF